MIFAGKIYVNLYQQAKNQAISLSSVGDQKVDQKFWVGYGQTWMWPVWSWDSKVGCI